MYVHLRKMPVFGVGAGGQEVLRLELTVDSASHVPLYIQIYEQMRILIETGKLKAGDQLPTESALRDQLGVSRMTVRQALSELVKDGMIVRKRAKGSFVAKSRREVPLVRDVLRSFTEEAANYGRRLETQILAQEIVPAEGRVAQELQVASGTKVVMVRRLRVLDNERIAVETSHLIHGRFPLLATLNLTNVSMYRTLKERYGVSPWESVDSYAAGPPTAAECKVLGLEPDSAVWHCLRTSFDRDGGVIEYTESAFRLDRFRFTTRRRAVGADE